MNEIISLILPHKAVFYYDSVAAGILLAIITVYADWSMYFANRKHWCKHNKIKSIKDNPEIYRLFTEINNGARKHFYLTAPLKFFTDYKIFLTIVILYLCVTGLTLGYVSYALVATEFPLPRPQTHLGKLVDSGRSSVVSTTGDGRLGKHRNGASLCSPRTEPLNRACAADRLDIYHRCPKYVPY